MAFNASKFVSTSLTDLSGVIPVVKNHFEGKGYTVEIVESSYGCFISLTKGGFFKSVLGMKTSLNIDVRKKTGGIFIETKVGIFGQQLIPTLIMLFVAWPVLFTQITGLVHQAKLDDEAINVIENAIRDNENKKSYSTDNAGQFCTQCGTGLPAGSLFCNVCGAKQ
jgi:hypothetical protein